MADHKQKKMQKFWLIFKREYLSRVRKKTFILATLLTPIGFALLFGVMLLLMSSGQEERRFGIVDESNVLQLKESGKSLRESPYVRFKPLALSLDAARKQTKENGVDALLYLPAQDSGNLRNLRMEYYCDEQIGLATQEYVKQIISAHLRELKMRRAGIDQATLDALNTSVELLPKKLTQKEGEKPEDEASKYRVYVATVLGFAMMMLIYLVVFIYGNMVMRSVMEEKTTRIVEVMVSSVKPFELMLGKIVGVGAVGLTQLTIWGIFTPLLYMLVGLFFAPSAAAAMPAGGGSDVAAEMASNPYIMETISRELASFNFWAILPLFLLYFVLGYILYASIFAAIGSAMNDDWGEGQSLILVVTIPVMAGFYIGTAAIQNPNGGLAVWSSMTPLFAPVVMPARLVFDPPFWQIALSLVFLILGCLFFVWLAGRIYRVGILMYGTKPTFMKMIRWIFTKH